MTIDFKPIFLPAISNHTTPLSSTLLVSFSITCPSNCNKRNRGLCLPLWH
ncbi:unnamed protein product [Arabidopsis halleri]